VLLPANKFVALLVAISFAAGLNVYATIATLGLLAHFDLLPLPTQLHLLENWWMIVASSILFAIEFFADKVPAFDLIWNALHTFVRVPIAALLAYGATSQLSLRNSYLRLSWAELLPSLRMVARPQCVPQSLLHLGPFQI
jgi:hypothetical protein